MDTKDVGYAVSIMLTFALGVWNLVVNYRNTRHTNYINTVTAQRVKWLEQIRQDISSFCGLAYTWHYSNLAGTDQEHDILKEIDRLRHVIRLRLNPSGTHDKTIEQLIAEIPKYTDCSQRDKFQKTIEELTTTSQLLLKEEWEKVKREVEHGNLKRDT